MSSVVSVLLFNTGFFMVLILDLFTSLIKTNFGLFVVIFSNFLLPFKNLISF